MVQSGKSTHRLTLSWPFCTPCEGDRVQSTLNSQVYRKRSTPKDWVFEVLTKMVVVQKHQIASEEWLVYARAFLAPTSSFQQFTPQESKRDLSQETKGARQKNRKKEIHQ
jgi:hypothetical protein